MWCGYGDEFMDMNIDVDLDWGFLFGEDLVIFMVVLDWGVGYLGFVGMVCREVVVDVVGMIMLVGDDFGDGLMMLMVLGLWDLDWDVFGLVEFGDWG